MGFLSLEAFKKGLGSKCQKNAAVDVNMFYRIDLQLSEFVLSAVFF